MTLRGAVADANAVQEYLERHLKIPNSQIRNLRDAQATRDAIIEALRGLSNDVRINNGDPIFIYYAGHGSETVAPPAWKTEEPVIQALVPYDCGTKINDREVPGIPDRTVGALLSRLAQIKGNNIVRFFDHSFGCFNPNARQTVVFDCCHSGSGTRNIKTNGSHFAVPRLANIPKILPDVDRNIWGAPAASRSASVAPGFLRAGLNSHVLLAACGARELAMEVQGRGVFTKAFLEVLTTVGAGSLTYAGVLLQIQPLGGSA
jgi:hypothetical protein